MIEQVLAKISTFIDSAPFALFGALDDKVSLKSTVKHSREQWNVAASTPLVSIIMPMYNSDVGQLEDAILSVLAQSYPNWELLAVDDGSSKQKHFEVIESYAKLYPNKIFFRKFSENKGISAARNLAISMSIGEYVGILDHDDLLHPLAISESVKSLLANKATFSYSFEVKITDDGKDLREFLSKPQFSWFSLLHLNYICHFSVIQRALLNSVRLDDGRWFNSYYDGAEDHDLFLRCSKSEHFRPVVVPQFLYLWRMTAQSTSTNQSNKPLSKSRSVFAALDHLKPNEYLADDGYIQHPLRSHTYIQPSVSDKKIRVTAILTAIDNFHDSESRISDQAGLELNIVSSSEHDLIQCSHSLNAKAFSATGDYLLFIHPHLKFRSPSILREAVEWMEMHPSIGSVGVSMVDVPRVPSVDSPEFDPPNYRIHTAYCIREHPGLGGGFLYSSYLEKRWFAFESRQVLANTRHFMLVRRTDFISASGFDSERFSTLGYDLDFCLRLEAKGLININLGIVGVDGYELDECKVGYGESEQTFLYDKVSTKKSVLQICYNHAFNTNELKF